jgi:N-acyl-D-amino-acid deacylase
VDARGADLAPGFIDTHTHADFSLAAISESVTAANFLEQGVTTVVGGNCGRGPVDVAAFRASLDRHGAQVNMALLVGLGSVHRQVMGDSPATPDPAALREMEALVERGLTAGAVGVSTGLEYVPGRFMGRQELAALLSVAGRHHALHATHMRDESAEIVAAVKEVVELSADTGVPLLVSHFKILGANNARMYTAVAALFREATTGARPVTLLLDHYPYGASSTSTDVLLPDWYMALDRRSRARVLASAGARARFEADIVDALAKEGRHDLGHAYIASFTPRREWQGRSIAEVAQSGGGPEPASLEAQLDVLVYMVSRGGAQIVYENLCPGIAERVAADYVVMVGSDSAIRARSGASVPHPRGWGTFPRYLRRLVREEKVLSLDEAVHRMTGLPAAAMRLGRRGLVREGFAADLVLFDSASITDRSTYEDPYAPPDGIRLVWVNGVRAAEPSVLHSGQLRSNGRMPGRFLPRDDSLPPLAPLTHPILTAGSPAQPPHPFTVSSTKGVSHGDVLGQRGDGLARRAAAGRQ